MYANKNTCNESTCANSCLFFSGHFRITEQILYTKFLSCFFYCQIILGQTSLSSNMSSLVHPSCFFRSSSTTRFHKNILTEWKRFLQKKKVLTFLVRAFWVLLLCKRRGRFWHLRPQISCQEPVSFFEQCLLGFREATACFQFSPRQNWEWSSSNNKPPNRCPFTRLRARVSGKKTHKNCFFLSKFRELNQTILKKLITLIVPQF